jgi:hypothetical protein
MFLRKYLVLVTDTSGAGGYSTEDNGEDGAVHGNVGQGCCVRLLQLHAEAPYPI